MKRSRPQLPGLTLASGVDDHVIAVALEANARVLSGHPQIERVVQEHVGQQGRDRRTLGGPAIALDQTAVPPPKRRLQPPLDVEEDPAQVGVMSHRAQDEVVRDAVEKRLQVQVENPILSPAALPTDPDRVQGRPARPIPVGVRVKMRLHPGLQVSAYDGLGDPVRDRRHPEHPRAAVPLRYLHRTHRRREVAPRREPIPELRGCP